MTRIKLFFSPMGKLQLKENIYVKINIPNPLLIFRYDVILIENSDEVLRKFKTFDSRIVFGAEDFCWPDPKLEVYLNYNVFLISIFKMV